MQQQYFSSSMDYISYLILDHSLETADVTSGQACNRGCRAFWTILNQSICTQTVRRRFFLHLNWSTTFLISRCWCFPKEQQLMAASSSNSNLVSNGQRVPSGFSWFPLMLEEWVAWALKGIAARRLTSEWFNFSFQSLPSVSLFCFVFFLSFHFPNSLSSGAFLAGVPVQPVLLHYPNKLVSEVVFARGSKVKPIRIWRC